MTKKDMFDKLYNMYKEEMNMFFFFTNEYEEKQLKIYDRYADKAFQKSQILNKAIQELFGIDPYKLYFKD